MSEKRSDNALRPLPPLPLSSRSYSSIDVDKDVNSEKEREEEHHSLTDRNDKHSKPVMPTGQPPKPPLRAPSASVSVHLRSEIDLSTTAFHSKSEIDLSIKGKQSPSIGGKTPLPKPLPFPPKKQQANPSSNLIPPTICVKSPPTTPHNTPLSVIEEPSLDSFGGLDLFDGDPDISKEMDSIISEELRINPGNNKEVIMSEIVTDALNMQNGRKNAATKLNTFKMSLNTEDDGTFFRKNTLFIDVDDVMKDMDSFF